MIKIYSSHTCPYCEKLKRYFDSLDLQYDVLYIDDNRDYVKELVSLTGIAGVPVTVFENGEFVVGYDRENIDKQLEARKKSATHQPDPLSSSTRSQKVKVAHHAKTVKILT